MVGLPSACAPTMLKLEMIKISQDTDSFGQFFLLQVQPKALLRQGIKVLALLYFNVLSRLRCPCHEMPGCILGRGCIADRSTVPILFYNVACIASHQEAHDCHICCLRSTCMLPLVEETARIRESLRTPPGTPAACLQFTALKRSHPLQVGYHHFYIFASPY